MNSTTTQKSNLDAIAQNQVLREQEYIGNTTQGMREEPCEHGCAKMKWCGKCMFNNGNMTPGMDTKIIDGHHYIRMRDVSKQCNFEKKQAYERGLRKGRKEVALAVSEREDWFGEKIESMRKKGFQGEGLPFENSPEIYGNQRVESYRNGYNRAIDDILSAIKSNE